MDSPRKILGLIGGMGTVASAYMFDRLVALTPAAKDQDYIETIVHNNSRVPDRTAGILGTGPSPLPELERSVDLLTGLGVHCIVLACMTSHHFLPLLRRRTPVELIDGVAETARHCAARHPEVRRVGLLASSGALQAGVFQTAFAAHEIEVVTFSAQEQAHYFMEPVYAPWGIKAGNVTGLPRERILEGVRLLLGQGVHAVIAGCTEIPLVLAPADLSVPLLDTIDIMCEAAIARCLAE
jgi:aspartate racemase